MEALGRLYRRVPGLADAILNERNSASNTFMRGVGGGFEDDELRLKALERYDFLAPAEAELQAKTAVLVQSSLQALLQRNDRMGMAASIESRFPFLDEEVVRFALNTPIRFKLRRSAMVHDPKHPFVIDKALVRATADRYVDRPAARRRKAGFPTLGLRGLQVRSGAFAGSWVSQQFGAGQPLDVGQQVHMQRVGLCGRRGVGRCIRWRRSSCACAGSAASGCPMSAACADARTTRPCRSARCGAGPAARPCARR